MFQYNCWQSKCSSKSHLYVMSIRKILSPLLIISYICGSRVVEFPAGFPRRWFGLLYMLLLWSLYNFALIYGVIPYTIHYSVIYQICFALSMFIALLSIIFGMYHDKAFKNCIKGLIIVDNTLKKLGTITDYKLHMRTIWLILGWFIIATLIICGEILLLSSQNHIAQAIYISFIRIYCININIINDLTITSILWYVGLKFDQINEHLRKLTQDNKRRMKQTCERPVLLFHQFKYAKTSRNAYMIWILIHLHSELRKISYKIDLIFGTQMTIEMVCYFAFIALGSQEIFNMIFIDYYNNILYIILILVWLSLHIFRLFLINYECERVSIKANATGNFINRLLYSNCNVEIHENILQFLLMTQSPFRFYQLGLFQLGFKFLKKFTASVAINLATFLRAYTNE